jgi:hypothetical protein
MDTKTAKQFINEAINIAISKGCFNLIEAKNIISALDYINQIPEETKETPIEA